MARTSPWCSTELVDHPQLAGGVGVDGEPRCQPAPGVADGQRNVAQEQGQRRDGPPIGKGADHFAAGNLALRVQSPAHQPPVARAGVERGALAVHCHHADFAGSGIPQDGRVRGHFLVAGQVLGGRLPENGNLLVGQQCDASDRSRFTPPHQGLERHLWCRRPACTCRLCCSRPGCMCRRDAYTTRNAGQSPNRVLRPLSRRAARCWAGSDLNQRRTAVGPQQGILPRLQRLDVSKRARDCLDFRGLMDVAM